MFLFTERNIIWNYETYFDEQLDMEMEVDSDDEVFYVNP